EPTWSDIVTDMEAWSSSVRGARVHAGFTKALLSIWSAANDGGEPLRDFLAKHHHYELRGPQAQRLGAELYFTGHSLGSALATLALARTMLEGCTNDDCSSGQVAYLPVSGLYTFGSPRAMDSELADWLARVMQDRTPIFRFVHDADLVPFVPPRPFHHP